MTKKIFLHVGMPKCASSSIQKILSSEEFLKENNGKILYLSIIGNGKIIYGESLVAQAKKSPFGYISSLIVEELLKTREHKKNIKDQILRLFEKYDTLVLSCEGWGVKPTLVNDFFEKIFERKDFEIEIVGLVRPQVEWINSAWWQWGAWTGHDLDYWVERSFQGVNWYGLIQTWESFSWVDRSSFWELGSSALPKFMHTIGAASDTNRIINQGLPASLLRFFQYHREFRKGAHDSVNEFILSRWLDLGAERKSIWVLDRKKIDKILSYYKESNQNLMKILQDATCSNKWFSSEAYKDKKTEKYLLENFPKELNDELLMICKRSIKKNLYHKDGSVLRKVLEKCRSLQKNEEDTTCCLQALIQWDQYLRRQYP